MTVFPEGLEPVTDLGPASWVESALRDRPKSSRRIRGMIPPIFEAYARILHQIRPQNEEQQTMRWATRAAELGRELGAATGWW